MAEQISKALRIPGITGVYFKDEQGRWCNDYVYKPFSFIETQLLDAIEIRDETIEASRALLLADVIREVEQLETIDKLN